MEIDTASTSIDEASTSGLQHNSSNNVVPLTPNFDDFLQTGRTGRRNAVPDIANDKSSKVGTGELTMEIERLSCTDNKSIDSNPSTSNTPSQPPL